LAQNGNTGANGPIRVLLADDHTMFREGLARILASYDGGMEVIAEVPNDGEALEVARELSPDVVIMQVQLPFERAKQTLREMRSFPDPPKVVIVTMFESPRYLRGLTGVGASAYVVKTSSSEHLVAAVRAAVLDPKSENAVVGMPQNMLEGSEEGVESVLSARELEILCSWPAASLTTRSPPRCTSPRQPSSVTSPTSTRRWAWAPGARPQGRRS